MKRNFWKLPNGTEIETHCGSIGIKFPGKDVWVSLAPTLEDAEELLAVLNLDIKRTRAEMGKR
jgi:hypothetical protein